MKNLVRKIKTKLSKSRGFTLVELLFSIIILMLSTTVILQCFNLGLGNVIKETRASEAQLLCSALTSSLQNELTYARDIKITDGMLDTYFSSSRRMGENSRIDSTSGEIKIQTIIKNEIDGSITVTSEYQLVSSANYKAKNRAGVNNSDEDEYFLKAYLGNDSIAWNSTDNVFDVILWVDDATKAPITSAADAEKNALAYSHFRVKPLAPVR